LLPRAAHSAERSFSVAWQAPSECPDESALSRYVDQTVADAGQGPLSVRASGSVSKSADGRYVASLELDTGGAQPSVRSLDGRDCEAVSQAAALLIALAVRARVAPAPPAPPPVPPPAPPPVELPPPPPPPPGAPRLFLSLAPVVDVGSLPSASPGLGVGVGVRAAGVRAELGAAYFTPHSASVAGSPEKGAELSLVTFGARACLPWGTGAWQLGPCLGAGGSRMHGEGFGAREPRSGTAWGLELTAAGLASWEISSTISLGLSAGAALPLARPEFVIDDAGSVHRRDSLSGRFALSLDIYF